MKPDLSTREGRAAYRRELRGVAVPWRVIGLPMVMIGVIGMIWFGRGPQGLGDSSGGIASVLLVAVGWALLVVAIVKRTRYNKARLAEDQGPI